MDNKITLNEFREKLRNLEISEHELRKYVVVDDDVSKAFSPALKINPDEVDDGGLEADIALSVFNGWSRRRRQRKYRKKISDGWSGIKIVSEGDSWFQYPVLLDDTIDQLFDEYAIFSLGAAGDLLSDMVDPDEVRAAVRDNEPDIVMISGGGNDLLGEGRLKLALHRYDQNLTPEQYPNQNFTDSVKEAIANLRRLFSLLLSENPRLKILCHGYDYAIPDNGKWLGKPMVSLQIRKKVLQEDIIKVLINRYNDALNLLASEFNGSVFVVNCRGAVLRDEWHDELHPTNDGYERVAERFKSVIDSITHLESHTARKSSLCPGKEAAIKSAKDLDAKSFRQLVSKRGRELLQSKIGVTNTETERREIEADISKHFEKISGGADFLPASFLRDGAKRAKAVCRMNLPGGSGTGFLIATNEFIMTNNHVISSVDEAEQCIAEFGFEAGSETTEVRLDPERFFTTNVELDYTIVACKNDGLEDVEPIPLLRNPSTVTRGEKVNIVQHPRGREKEVALHDNDVLRIKDKVIWYETDTEPGSSGSPVFNNTWDLVALHHAGWHNTDNSATNEGVRIASIVSNLVANQSAESSSNRELRMLLKEVSDTSPHLGFFDVQGIVGDNIREVEVPEYRGSADYADIGIFNIEHFNSGISNTRVKRVAEVLAHLSLDVLGLVEVEKPAMDRLIEQLNNLGYGYSYDLLNVRGRQDIAVLYDEETSEVKIAHDLLQKHNNALKVRTSSGRTAFPRRPLIARVEVKSRHQHPIEFIMIVVHLKAFGDAESQARRRLAAKVLEEIIEDIRATENLPVVLGGDLNETLHTDVLSALTESPDLLTLTSDDADENALSYVGANHRSLIDHFIVSDDVRLGSIAGDDAAIVRLDKSVSDFVSDISDHVPLVIRMIGRESPLEVVSSDAKSKEPGVTIPDGKRALKIKFE